MTEPDERPALKDSSLGDLDARLKAARRRQAEASGAARKPGAAVGSSGMGVGFRLAIELVTGIVVGVVVGLLLDRWLGTLPLFLVVFFLLGSAAGFLNVYRAASGQGYAVGFRKTDSRDGGDGVEDRARSGDDASDDRGTGSGA